MGVRWLADLGSVAPALRGGWYAEGQDGTREARCSPCAAPGTNTLEPSATGHRFLIHSFPRLLLARIPTPLLIPAFIGTHCRVH